MFTFRNRCLLIVCLLLLPRVAQAQAYVNSATGDNPTGGTFTTLATETSFAATAANHIVCGIRWTQDAAQVVTGLSDTAGNTYAQAGTTIADAQQSALAVWYAQNITANGANIVTATWDIAAAYQSIVCIQHSGINTASSLDATATGTVAIGGTVTSGMFTTAQANEMVVAFGAIAFIGSNGWSPSAGASLRAQDDSQIMAGQSEFVTSTITNGTRTMTTTQTGVDQLIAVATFKTGGAPPPPPVSRRKLLWGLP